VKAGPFFSFAASLDEQFNRILLVRDSHRVRGVFSFVALLSPVESIDPPSELVAHSYLVRLGATGRKRNFSRILATRDGQASVRGEVIYRRVT